MVNVGMFRLLNDIFDDLFKYLFGIMIVYHIGHIEGLFIPFFSKPSGSPQAQVLETGETVDAGEFAKFYDLGSHWTLGFWIQI